MASNSIQSAPHLLFAIPPLYVLFQSIRERLRPVAQPQQPPAANPAPSDRSAEPPMPSAVD
jgi:hypothetical protein